MNIENNFLVCLGINNWCSQMDILIYRFWIFTEILVIFGWRWIPMLLIRYRPIRHLDVLIYFWVGDGSTYFLILQAYNKILNIQIHFVQLHHNVFPYTLYISFSIFTFLILVCLRGVISDLGEGDSRVGRIGI